MKLEIFELAEQISNFQELLQSLELRNKSLHSETLENI
jgi:hypothetical protein